MNLTSRFGGAAVKLALFLAVAGTAKAQLCPPGYYSPNGMVNEEIECSPGYFTPNAGMTAPDAANPGYYVPNAGASGETICTAGYFTVGMASTSPTAANPGYYVPNQGSSSEIICPAGYYAAGYGTIAPTICPGGYYAPQGTVNPIICPAGSYAPQGSGAPITCTAGYYTAGPGYASPTAASRGYYVPISGSSTETLCVAGYYTANPASTFPTPAGPGYYVPSSGSSAETTCPAGYYAPGTATVNPTICQPGYYSPQGASAETASPAGDFVPTNGATAPTLDPSGTWSHLASVAARSASPTAPRNVTNHVVGPIYFATPTNTIDLSSGPASLTVSNASRDLGVNDSLTALSLLSATLSGGNATNFQINGFVAGTLLYEKGATNINLSVVNPSSLSSGTYSTTLTVQTDQSAPFGSAGDSFNYTLTFIVAPPPTLAIASAGSANIVLTWTNAGYDLQSAPAASGAYTTIAGATSPYTNAIAGGAQFFRLIHQ